MINEITSIDQICELTKSGFPDWKQYGNVVVRTFENLLIFNYTQEAIFEGRWNFFEMVSRGLIIDSITGEVVARPFDKFFNWGEKEKYSNSLIVSITEKVDGSLGILYRHNGEYKIATRGSFNGDQALWATEFLKKYDLSSIPNEYTLLFEIVYPENRIVVDYGNREDLVLLAARNRFNGNYLRYYELQKLAHGIGFSMPIMFEFISIDDLVKTLPKLDVNQEGYVVEFMDGQRFKFKGDKYIELHRLICMLSFKNTLAACESGTIGNIRLQIPDEFLGEFNGWVDEINIKINEIVSLVSNAFIIAPTTSRKDFAIWVMNNYKDYSYYFFAMFDHKDILPMIYKTVFKNRKDSKKIGEEDI